MLKGSSQIILGVDPGSVVTGYGVLQREGRRLITIDYGCIRPKKTPCLATRYRQIFEGIDGLIKQYAITDLAVETQYIKKNPQSGIKLGMARGVIMVAAALLEIPVFEYAPSKAKRAVVGNGRASKKQVQSMVKHLLGLAQMPTPEDAADALALAICHAHTMRH